MNTMYIEEDEIRIAIFKALSDSVRLDIIRVLKKEGREMNCGEIADKLNVNKSTISYHFRTLRESGLTITRKESKNRFISLQIQTFNRYIPGFLETL